MYKQGEGGCYGAQAKRGGNVMILLIDNYDSFSYNLFQLGRHNKRGYKGDKKRRNER